MAVLDWVKQGVRDWLGITPARRPGPPREATGHTGHVTSTGRRYRLSEDNPTNNCLQGLTILAPLYSERRWRNLSLGENALDRRSTADVGDLLADLSPEIRTPK